MAEYIEREAAIEICSDQYKECLRKNDWCGDTVAWNIGFGIKAIPAADVVEVVRCKDCIFNNGLLEFGDLQCGILDVPMKNDDFCSYGERKEQ